MNDNSPSFEKSVFDVAILEEQKAPVFIVQVCLSYFYVFIFSFMCMLFVFVIVSDVENLLMILISSISTSTPMFTVSLER